MCYALLKFYSTWLCADLGIDFLLGYLQNDLDMVSTIAIPFGISLSLNILLWGSDEEE